MKKLLCLFLALLLTACGQTKDPAPEVTGSLEVRFTDLGAYITCGEETMLIATVAKAESLKEEQVDQLVLTQMPDKLPSDFETIYAPGMDVPESLRLGQAEVRFFPGETELSVEVRFGQRSFLFLGRLSPEGQDALVSQWKDADVLSVSGGMEPRQALPETLAPQYVLVSGKSVARWPESLEVFETAAFGPVTLTTKGENLDIRWGLHTQDEAAA
jgi:hypothetical protein